MAKTTLERRTKFVVEYKDDSGRITDRWHYDLEKFNRGPILVENCSLPPKQKKKRVAKVKKV